MFLFALILPIILAASEIDIIIPSFPEIQGIFGLSAFKVELLLTLNLISHCIAALFAGILGDKYGKKHIITLGLIIFVIGSFVSVAVDNFYIILLGRVLQGIGIAPSLVLTFAIAIDKFPNSGPKTMGILNGFYAFALAVAPAVGSLITNQFGYKGNLFILAILGIISLIVVQIFVPDDKKSKNDLSINILSAFIPVFKNRDAMLYSFALCLSAGCYFTIVGLAPLFYIETLKVSLIEFGLYQSVPGFSFAVLYLISGFILKVLGKLTYRISIFFIVMFILSNLALILGKFVYPITVSLTMLFYALGMIFFWNLMFGLALSSDSVNSGKISAIFNTLRWILASIGIGIASHFYSGTYLSIGLTALVLFTSALTLMIVAYKKDNKLREAVN